MFLGAVITIALISVALSFLSLKNLKDKSEIEKVSESLREGKVIYKSDHSDSSSEDSS